MRLKLDLDVERITLRRCISLLFYDGCSGLIAFFPLHKIIRKTMVRTIMNDCIRLDREIEFNLVGTMVGQPRNYSLNDKFNTAILHGYPAFNGEIRYNGRIYVQNPCYIKRK